MNRLPPLADQFPPQVLRQYALIADGERGIIVGPRGDFCWMCLPRWDSAPVFSTLLGGGGVYVVAPAEPRFVWGRAIRAALPDLAITMGDHRRDHRMP